MVDPTFPSEQLQLASRWCALSVLGSRRLRSSARTPLALNRLWREHAKPKLSAPEALSLRRWFAEGNQVLFPWTDEFPESLRAIPDPPVALFVSGDLNALNRPRVAIVGSRSASHSGVAFARELAAALASKGALVVSGLAQGIDYAAHSGALGCQQPTVAIPGSGLSNIYPRSHRGLAQKILLSGGVLLSEYAPWVAARKASFPARNRLISGLTAGVVVVQAALKSGSLITARLAAEQGREVMAVPGLPGAPNTAGCNALLRDGAALIECVEDVFDALNWSFSSSNRQATNPQSASTVAVDVAATLTAETRLVLSAIDTVPLTIESLLQLPGLAGAELEQNLLTLQLHGLVQATAQGYIRAPR